MIVLYIISILFIIPSFTFSQNEDSVLIYAEKKRYIYGKKYWDLLGNPVLKKGSDSLSAKSIKYFQEKKRAIAKGNIKIFSYKDSVEVFGKYGEYHTDSGYAKLITDTKLIAIKDNITINSEIIERFKKKKIYTARNNVKIVMEKDNAVITAQNAVYSLSKKTITLKGSPIINQNGWEYKAKEIIFHTKTRIIVLNGESVARKDNQKIISDRIEYYSEHPKKKSIFTGHTKFIEYSDKQSFLRGKPYREVYGKKVIFYNYGEGKAVFLGKAFMTEFFLKKATKPNRTDIFMYKRQGSADTIKYIGGDEKKVALIGNAKIFEPNKVAFADRIDYIDGREKIAILRGKAYFYEFYKKSESYSNYNSVKLKAKANTIKYFTEKDKVILEGGANIFGTDGYLQGDRVIYWSGEKEYGYAEGNAQLNSNNAIATADIIKYFKKEEKTILAGNARYKKDDIRARARLIEHYEKENKTKLKGDVLIIENGEKKIITQDIVYKKTKGVETATLFGWSQLIKKNKVLAGNYIEYYSDKNGEKVFIREKASYKERHSKKDEDEKKWIFADQIIYYTIPKPGESNDEKILLKGNTRVINSKRTLSGDNGEYYISNSSSGKTEKGFVYGNCEIIKKDTSQQAFSDRVEYFKDKDLKERYLLKGKVDFNNKDRLANSDSLTIFPDFKPGIDKIIFLGSPNFEDSESFARGDRIEMLDGNINQTRIFGNVKFVNKKEFSEISSGYLLFDDDREYVRVEKEPVFIQKDDDFIIYGNVIESFRETKISIATGDVKAIQKSKTIYGEYLKYIKKEKKLWVVGNATLETDNNITRAKRIVLNTKTKEVEMIGVRRSKLDPYGKPKKE